MQEEVFAVDSRKGRSPHGERGLKYDSATLLQQQRGRSPHGERGLKLRCLAQRFDILASLPTRGAWIEMFDDRMALVRAG